jgi:hypothetical protein
VSSVIALSGWATASSDDTRAPIAEALPARDGFLLRVDFCRCHPANDDRRVRFWKSIGLENDFRPPLSVVARMRHP